jgi:hypothetical protein
MLTRLRSERLRALAACYLAVTILLAYPLSVHPASRVLADAPDTHLYLWTLMWDAHAFLHQPLGIFDANIFYPERHTLAYSENLIGSAFFAAPVLWVTGNPVLAMNVLLLLSTVLCGLGAYLLARRTGVGGPGAALAGIVFAFAPPRFLRLDQVHLATLQWMPFSLAFLHAYFGGGRRRDLWLSVGCFSMQALTSGHGAVFLGVAITGLLLVEAVSGRVTILRKMVSDLGIPGALLLAPAILVAVPYLEVQHEVGLRRSLEDWSVPPASLLASPSHVHTLLLGLAHGTWINDTASAYLFPGFLALLLAAGAFATSRQPQPASSPLRVRVFYGLLFFLSLWLVAPRPIGLWPYVYWLPGLNLIRAPSRFMLLGLLAVAVLAGFGFDRLAMRLAPARPALLAAIVGVLLIGEYATMPLGTEPYRVEIPSIDQWLAGRPQPFVAAEVPLPDPSNMGRSQRRQTAYMLAATAAWWKTVHGYSGFVTAANLDLYRRLATFPSDEAVRSLETTGVTYLVVHSDDYSPEEWPRINNGLNEFRDRLTLVHDESGGRVYAVTASLQPTKR